jgi:hypothetical protein
MYILTAPWAVSVANGRLDVLRLSIKTKPVPFGCIAMFPFVFVELMVFALMLMLST